MGMATRLHNNFRAWQPKAPQSPMAGAAPASSTSYRAAHSGKQGALPSNNSLGFYREVFEIVSFIKSIMDFYIHTFHSPVQLSSLAFKGLFHESTTQFRQIHFICDTLVIVIQRGMGA